jgi:glycerophosphoryl diester phosphodiesterase
MKSITKRLGVLAACLAAAVMAFWVGTPLLSAEPVAEPPQAQWTVRGNLPQEKFVIQSHRGAGVLEAENTLEAFELGWKLGTYPECDVRTTKDGQIVTFHDDNFSRVVKNIPDDMKKKGVKDVTWDDLKKMDVGAWKGEKFQGKRVVTIGEVFERMAGKPERHLYMDIKNIDFEQLAGEVKKYKVEAQVVLASTKYDQIRLWKKLVPQSDTLHWMGGTAKSEKDGTTEAVLRKRIEDLRRTNFADITQLQIHVRLKPGKTLGNADAFSPSEAFLKEAGDELRRHGIVYQCLPWGIDDPRVYWRLLDLGVMSFATDHPDVTTDAVRKYYAGQTQDGSKK